MAASAASAAWVSIYLQVCEATSGDESHEAHLVGGIRSVMSGEIPKFSVEYPYLGPNQRHWFSVSVTRFNWDGPPHVVVAHEDVTHRREAKASMRASEARFRAAAEGSLDSFFILERVRADDGALHDLCVVYSNARGAALLNRPLHDIVGHQLRELVSVEHIQGFIDSCGQVIETRLAVEGTNRVHAPEIYAEWLHFQIVPLDDGVAVTIRDVSEETRAAEALQKREQQLSEAQQIAHIGSWDVDVNTSIATWSDESYRIHGLEPQCEKLTVARVFEFIHPDDIEKVHETVARAKQNLEPFLLQHRLVRPDGAMRIVESRAEIVTDKDGAPVRVIGTMHDVTERVGAEWALLETQERLQAIITGVDMVIWSLDREGVITMSEGKGLSSVGLEPGQVVGRNIFDLFPEGSPSAGAARLVLTGEDVSITLENSGIYWETRYSPLRDRDGEIIGATGVAIDITERLEAENALVKSNQQITTIWESMAHAFYALNHEWRFTYLNSQAERLLQCQKKELLDKVIWEVFPESAASSFFHQYQRAIEGQVPVSFEEYYAPLDTWLEVRAYPSEVGLSVYFDDISERKRAEAALRQAEEKYRSIFEHAVEGIFQSSLDSRYVNVNPALARIYGYASPEELVSSVTDISQQLFVDSQRCNELLQI
jgi:PAS domain S-box-containing protein